MISTILYDGITGSTNLLSALSKHPNVNCFLGNPFGSGENVTPDYCDTILDSLEFKNDKCNIFKFRYTGYPSINKSIDHMCSILDNFIIIIRSDCLSHAFSHEIKMRTNQSNIRKEDAIVEVDPFTVDIKYIKNLIKDKNSCRESVLNMTNDKRRIVLDYNTLFSKNSMDSIQEFLGLESMNLVGDYKKLNSTERYRKLILNYDEVVRECDGLFKK